MNIYAIYSALLKGGDPTSSVFFEIVKTPVIEGEIPQVTLAGKRCH